MNRRIPIILILFLVLFIVVIPKSYGACYKTLEGNDYTINYNSDKTKITSITGNFSYIDNVDIANKNNSNRQYYMIFTKDASKKRSYH